MAAKANGGQCSMRLKRMRRLRVFTVNTRRAEDGVTSLYPLHSTPTNWRMTVTVTFLFFMQFKLEWDANANRYNITTLGL